MAPNGIVAVRAQSGVVWKDLAEGTWTAGRLSLVGIPGPLLREIETGLRHGEEYGDWVHPESGDAYQWVLVD